MTRAHVTSNGSWQVSGRAWGARALDWAYLFEPYARPAYEVLFDRLEVTSGMRLIDIACGSGLAASYAARLGAQVKGLDASDELIQIARQRTPGGEFHVGDMASLPFADACFDVASSFNGIWKHCEPALEQARRVLTPAGRLGLSFWGRYDQIGLMPYFLKVMELSPPSHGVATMEQGDTGRTGVIEDMLTATGFLLRERGTVTVVNDWPDVDIAVRALAAAGPSIPAIDAVGYDRFCESLAEVIAPLHVRGTGITIASELGWITADRGTDERARAGHTPPNAMSEAQAGGVRDAERGHMARGS